MDFLGMGPAEIFVILILALILLGPQKLPGIARTLGKTMRTIKRASNDLSATISREMEASLDKPSSPPKETKAVEKPPVKEPKPPSPEEKTINHEEAPAPK